MKYAAYDAVGNLHAERELKPGHSAQIFHGGTIFVDCGEGHWLVCEYGKVTHLYDSLPGYRPDKVQMLTRTADSPTCHYDPKCAKWTNIEETGFSKAT
jgi:hypothetical protein